MLIQITVQLCSLIVLIHCYFSQNTVFSGESSCHYSPL